MAQKKKKTASKKKKKQTKTITLKEHAKRLRIAECIAKGGQYRNGECHKN